MQRLTKGIQSALIITYYYLTEYFLKLNFMLLEGNNLILDFIMQVHTITYLNFFTDLINVFTQMQKNLFSI